MFLLELAGARVSQIGLKGTRVSLIGTKVSLIRIKVFLFWRTDGCQATLFPKGTAQPQKRRHCECDLVSVGCTMIDKRDAVQYGDGLREVRDESGWA